MIPTTAPAALRFTGERFTPESRGAIWYEHWHRYCLVAPLVRGRRVLDAACGEGYGSALLARTAASVVGVDLGEAAVAHARARYDAPNLAFEPASVTALPLRDASVDVVVSFETIEHLEPQREMLAEFRRVLAPEGVLVISSPNRPVYNEGAPERNEFHVRELDRAELAQLLAPHFPQQAWYAQRVAAHSVVWREGAAQGAVSYDVLDERGPSVRGEPAPPMYFIVVGAASGVALPSLPAVSLFDDGALALWRDYAALELRVRRLAWDEIDARRVGEDRLADLARTMRALDVECARAAALEADLDARRNDLERIRAELAHTRSRLEFRESVAGWLRWPLAAARRRLQGDPR